MRSVAMSLAGLLCLLPSAVVGFSPSSMRLAPARLELRASPQQPTSMTLRESSCQAAVSRRQSLLLAGAGAVFFGSPRPGHADSFEEFMAKKQRKEREDQARKAGVTVGGGDGDDDDDVCGSVEECEAMAGSGSSAPKPAAAAANAEGDDDVEIAERGKPRAPSARDEYKNVKPVKDTDPVKTALVTVLRVQESTLQEARLITTGNFRDLQRNNIKMATKMMVENTKINDVIVKASGFATDKSKVSEANEVGRDAVQDLVAILDYFDDAGREIKVSELPASKKEFILKAFTSARDKLDKFLSYMPKEKVAAARQQVITENELNQKELPKDMQILNPVFMN